MSDTKTKKPGMEVRSQNKDKSEIGPTMSGSEILVAALEREMVDTIFAYPGGASMELHQALTRSDKIRVILPRHEQGGVFAAEGYARASGRPGVCMATSGPGATNLVTGIADAFMDSTPLVAITGQVPQVHGRSREAWGSGCARILLQERGPQEVPQRTPKEIPQIMSNDS